LGGVRNKFCIGSPGRKRWKNKQDSPISFSWLPSFGTGWSGCRWFWLVLGVIWAFWHLPLFFIPGTSQTFMPFAGFVYLTTGYSWFFAWVRHASGKRTWAGLISHGWANAFVPLFPTVVMAAEAAQPRYWIWVSLTFVIGLITMAIRSRKTK